MTQISPFRYFKTSPEIIRLAVMMYVRFPLSLRNVEDLLHERGIDISHETIRYWWNRFGPIFAADIKRKRIQHMRAHSNWKWHLDEVFVKINGETHYLWRAVDHEGEVLESVVTKRRDKRAALKILRKLMRNYGEPETIVTDKLKSYGAALRELGISGHETNGRWINNRAENSHSLPDNDLLENHEKVLFDNENAPRSASGAYEVCGCPSPSTPQPTTTSTRNAPLLSIKLQAVQNRRPQRLAAACDCPNPALSRKELFELI